MKKTVFPAVLMFFAACHGPDGPEGPIGPTGKNSLIKMSKEPAGVNCLDAGIKLESGVDEDGNNVLDASEVQQTEYVCNGIGVPKELRLWSVSGAATYGGVAISFTIYDQFNIDNFPGYDSAVLVTNNPMFYNSAPPNDQVSPKGVFVTVQLVDVTHDKPFTNSFMGIGPYQGQYVSPNFYKDLPKGPIRLGFSIGSTDPNYNILVGETYFILARK